MNERIKELSKKAVDYANVCESEAWDGAYERKFAELLIQECADFLKDKLDDHFAAEQLEEHFGVEE